MRETILPGDPAQRQGLELDSLRLTRAALRAKTTSLALAVFFTTLVFCAVPPWHPIVEILRQGGKWSATALMLVGAFFWWRFIRTCLALRGTGLPPQRGIGPRLAWLAGGWLITEAMYAVVWGWKDGAPRFYFVPAAAFAAVWLGEKLHQLATPVGSTAGAHHSASLS